MRYELVGAGHHFYREQRVGFWDLEWEPVFQREYRLRRWQSKDETRSRSTGPCYADITAQAFGGNSSYSRQMLPGVDHWRTVLDGACGIDIYGHNGVSVGDIDDDGYDDLYVCQPAGLPNRLYRNRGTEPSRTSPKPPVSASSITRRARSFATSTMTAARTW